MDSSIENCLDPWSDRKHKMCCLTIETGRIAERYERAQTITKQTHHYLPSRVAVLRVQMDGLPSVGPSVHPSFSPSFQHLRRRIKFIFGVVPINALLQPTHHLSRILPAVRTCLRNCRMSCQVLPMGSAGVRSWTARIVEPIPAATSAAEIDAADPMLSRTVSGKMREQQAAAAAAAAAGQGLAVAGGLT